VTHGVEVIVIPAAARLCQDEIVPRQCSSTLLLSAALLTAPVLCAQNPASTDQPSTNRGAGQPAAVHNPGSLRELSASFEELAARVRPSVVQIFATGYAPAEENDSGTNTALLTKQTSTGTGVIVSPEGYIVTNNHVVQGARKMEVKLPTADPAVAQNGTIPAKLIGTDRETDLAVIKIERTGLPVLLFADSSQLHQGELVMAFGNPRGLEGSMSMGVVSSTGRQLKTDDPMMYIQTDAPINPGNSGGPLVDVEGHVVGLNTLILTQSGGSEGLGFAIPSNLVRTIYEQIRKDGHVHRGQIGLDAQTITPVLAKGLGLPVDAGIVVSDVAPDGPADKAGLKIGDIIQSMNGRPVGTLSQLQVGIANQPLTQSVPLTVLREGRSLDFTVAVIEREDDPQRFADMVDPQDNLIPQLGVLGIDLNQQLADMLPDLRHDYGVVVGARTAVAPYSGSSLQPGDVIYEINRTPVVSIKVLRDALDALKSGDDVVLQVQRNEKLLYVVLELE
jgi:serine protease Do